jgi:hypothetical protein
VFFARLSAVEGIKMAKGAKKSTKVFSFLTPAGIEPTTGAGHCGKSIIKERSD